MNDLEYLTSDELRFFTGKSTTFLQVDMLNKHKIPHCLDEYGTPLVRFKDVHGFTQFFEDNNETVKLFGRLRGK